MSRIDQAQTSISSHISALRELRKTASDEEWLKVGWDFLETMGLGELRGCDIDIMPILEQIPPGSEFVDVQCFLQHTMVEVLLDYLENGGSTALLDVEKLKGTPAEPLIPRILESRRREIENLTIPVVGSEIVIYNLDMEEVAALLKPDRGKPVLLEPLWLTAHGRQILSSLQMGLRTDISGLKRIQKALARLGTRTTPVRVSEPPTGYRTSISEAMQKVLLRGAQDQSTQREGF
ncbi:MAG: hypothetical protein DRO87_03615 [Candidatus Thorarchaeota archaeon]|nr:MAG: hypothetical protein DRP09_05810 [Candidatus Thorarchaeota archaeon]RLI59212.1 MAG: hypothetical protein DRO87_03615 [Candidatus Thorarchaeota archaeon]